MITNTNLITGHRLDDLTDIATYLDGLVRDHVGSVYSEVHSMSIVGNPSSAIGPNGTLTILDSYGNNQFGFFSTGTSTGSGDTGTHLVGRSVVQFSLPSQYGTLWCMPADLSLTGPPEAVQFIPLQTIFTNKNVTISETFTIQATINDKHSKVVSNPNYLSVFSPIPAGAPNQVDVTFTAEAEGTAPIAFAWEIYRGIIPTSLAGFNFDSTKWSTLSQGGQDENQGFKIRYSVSFVINPDGTVTGSKLNISYVGPGGNQTKYLLLRCRGSNQFNTAYSGFVLFGAHDSTNTGCFIVTAAADHQEMVDDFRTFRDTFMSDKMDEVNEYYEIAPVIVSSICSMTNCNVVFDYIRDTFLKPAWLAIKEKRNEDAYKIYSRMIAILRKRFLK